MSPKSSFPTDSTRARVVVHVTWSSTTYVRDTDTTVCGGDTREINLPSRALGLKFTALFSGCLINLLFSRPSQKPILPCL